MWRGGWLEACFPANTSADESLNYVPPLLQLNHRNDRVKYNRVSQRNPNDFIMIKKQYLPQENSLNIDSP
jgi:hypothetical protein